MFLIYNILIKTSLIDIMWNSYILAVILLWQKAILSQKTNNLDILGHNKNLFQNL